MSNVNIYELRATVDELMNESKGIMNYALKQSMSLDYLGELNSDDLKAMAGLTNIFKSFEKFMTVEADVIKDMYERQERIDYNVKEINKKLDEIKRNSKE